MRTADDALAPGPPRGFPARQSGSTRAGARDGHRGRLGSGTRRSAGTTTRRWLDPIAWYGGNCGVEFELLENGVDISKWAKKQHKHTKGGTRPGSGGREPRIPFGLHDVLGNVYEWCTDRVGV